MLSINIEKRNIGFYQYKIKTKVTKNTYHVIFGEKKKMKLTFLNIDAYKLYLNIKIKWNINFKLQNCKPNKLFFFVLRLFTMQCWKIIETYFEIGYSKKFFCSFLLMFTFNKRK